MGEQGSAVRALIHAEMKNLKYFPGLLFGAAMFKPEVPERSLVRNTLWVGWFMLGLAKAIKI